MPYSEDPNDPGFSDMRNDVTRRPGPWVAATFDLEDMYTGVPGWLPQEVVTRQGVDEEHIEPVTWNGWDCPHFEKASADLIVRQHNEHVQSLASRSGHPYSEDLLARFDADTDSYQFFIVNGYDPDEGRHSGEWEAYTGIKVEVEPGHSFHLYPIGAWSWIWERSDI